MNVIDDNNADNNNNFEPISVAPIIRLQAYRMDTQMADGNDMGGNDIRQYIADEGNAIDDHGRPHDAHIRSNQGEIEVKMLVNWIVFALSERRFRCT